MLKEGFFLVYNALRLNKKEFVILNYYRYIEKDNDSTFYLSLLFYKSNNYLLINRIKIGDEAPLYDFNSEITNENMCLINNDLLCVGIKKLGIYLIKISTHEIITSIEDNYDFFSIKPFLDKYIIISQYFGDSFIIFKHEKEHLEKVEIIELEYDILQILDNKIILTYNKDVINLWKLNKK